GGRAGGDRRGQADGRGPRQPGCQAPPVNRRAGRRRRRRPAGPAERLHRVPGRHPVAGAEVRPRAGGGDRGAGGQRHQRLAGPVRLAVRQRLQPVRPDLAGERPGRPPVPQRRRRPPTGDGQDPAGGDGDARRVRLGPGGEVVPGDHHRYNLYPSAAVTARPAPGVSSGQAIAHLEETANANLPADMKVEWTELALLQLQSGNTAFWAFLLSVVLVFLVLAAQYESWALPLAVILVVPMCLLCAAAGVLAAGHDVNVFTQIGFVVLIGLACKNAILIVEYARTRHEGGATIRQATLEACRLRLRPIVMTSVAFILGVVPLLAAEGAAAEMRR